MSNDESPAVAPGNTNSQNAKARTEKPWSLFEVPPSLKRIFDKFPLTTYAANELPQRAPKDRTTAVLYTFTTDQDAQDGRPSFNPGCLRWQAYLKFRNIQFSIAASNNHASPSGALPYLQPKTKDEESTITPDPIPSNRLKKWVHTQGSIDSKSEDVDERYDSYSALIDDRLRKAWLYQLYLAAQNTSVVDQLYIKPCSSNPMVKFAIANQLHAAAEAELVKACKGNTVSAFDLIKDAKETLRALSILLGDDEWFFAQQQPGLLDASLFAYTHLFLNRAFQWKYNPTGECLQNIVNLVQHSERIYNRYF